MAQLPTLLVTGACGGLTSVLVDRIKDKYKLVGVDPRKLPSGRRFPGEFHQVDYTHRKMAEVFRSHKFDVLLHLGRIRTSAEMSSSERYNMNVLGTRNLLSLALKYGVKKIIVLSTFHVYGALQHNHLFIREDEPLRASQSFSELNDAVELDSFAMTFLFQHPEVHTIILRPCNIIGPRINNEMSRMLRSDYCPALLGFDPMMQFVDARDLSNGLVHCLEQDRSGVFNVAGEGVIPYLRAIENAGARVLPIPHMIAPTVIGVLGKLGMSRIPRHLIDYIRYPTIVSDEAFRKSFGYRPEVSTVDALHSLRVKVPSVID